MQGDISILNDSQGIFVLNFRSFESLRSFGYKECLNVVIFSLVPSPNDDIISKGGIANPPLLTIQNVSTLNLLRRCLERSGVGAIIRFGESEATNFIHVNSL